MVRFYVAGGGGGHALAGGEDEAGNGTRPAEAAIVQLVAEDAGCFRFDFHSDVVAFEAEDGVAFADGGAIGEVPLGNETADHSGTELGNEDRNGHEIPGTRDANHRGDLLPVRTTVHGDAASRLAGKFRKKRWQILRGGRARPNQ
jgi:hypothetical protein